MAGVAAELSRSEWRTAIAQLGRTSLLGVTVVFALQGLASAGGVPSALEVVTTIVAASGFHVAAYLGNDIVDLPIDRTVERRASSPLVRGTVTRREAGVIVAVAAAVALVAAGSAGAGGAGAMALALALLGTYDVAGKRCVFPPLTDAVQGLGWAALAWSGASIGAGATAATAWLGAYLAMSIVLVNGVHGSLRDLGNDARHGARTTALLLGASVDASGRHRLPAGLWIYALTLHVAVVATVVVGLGALGGATPARTALALGAGVVCLGLLVVALRWSDRGAAAWPVSFAYLVVMMLLPTLLVVDQVRGALLWAIALLFAIPWLASDWLRAAVRRPAAVGGRAST